MSEQTSPEIYMPEALVELPEIELGRTDVMVMRKILQEGGVVVDDSVIDFVGKAIDRPAPAVLYSLDNVLVPKDYAMFTHDENHQEVELLPKSEAANPLYPKDSWEIPEAETRKLTGREHKVIEYFLHHETEEGDLFDIDQATSIFPGIAQDLKYDNADTASRIITDMKNKGLIQVKITSFGGISFAGNASLTELGRRSHVENRLIFADTYELHEELLASEQADNPRYTDLTTEVLLDTVHSIAEEIERISERLGEEFDGEAFRNLDSSVPREILLKTRKSLHSRLKKVETAHDLVFPSVEIPKRRKPKIRSRKELREFKF